MRIFPLAVLAAITVAAGSVTAAVALADGSATTVADRPGNQRLLGIHHYSLKDGVTPEEFERFVAEEYNPGMSKRVPGIRVLVMKGERNASANEYLVVWDIQSVDVRDWYWPNPDSTAAVWSEVCGDECTALFDRMTSMAEQTSYTDYVEIVRD